MVWCPHGVFRLSDYLDEVVQPVWSYWALDRCESQSGETRKAHGRLRRYRAALRKFARSESANASILAPRGGPDVSICLEAPVIARTPPSRALCLDCAHTHPI